MIISINKDRRYSGRNYETLDGKAPTGGKVVETRNLLGIKENNETIIIHANDIEDDDYDDIFNNVTTHQWKIYLFTNDDTRGTSFSNQIVYTWEEIVDSYPVLPPKNKNMPNINALNILCQGYLAAHKDKELYNELPIKLQENARVKWNELKNNWWRPIDIKSITAEIVNLTTHLKIESEPERVIKIFVDNLNIFELVNGKKNMQKVQETYASFLALEKSVIEKYGRWP